MVLSSLDDKWAQDKINTAYMALKNCITCTKQGATIQPYYTVSYCGDINSLSMQCPKPIRAEPLWATNLCTNTTSQIGVVCANGTVSVMSQCLSNTYVEPMVFCSERRYTSFMGLRDSCDFYCVVNCGNTSYSDCLWNGTSEQYSCRKSVQKACIQNWQTDVNNLLIAYKSNKTCCTKLKACYACYGCWNLPYPCFVSCTWDNASHTLVLSRAYTYCGPNNERVKNTQWTYGPVYNTASQLCDYSYILPQKQIGIAIGSGYCIGGYCYGCERSYHGCALVGRCYYTSVCRVIDVYTVCNTCYNNCMVYYLKAQILCKL